MATYFGALHEMAAFWCWGVPNPEHFALTAPIPLTELIAPTLASGLILALVSSLLIMLVLILYPMAVYVRLILKLYIAFQLSSKASTSVKERPAAGFAAARQRLWARINSLEAPKLVLLQIAIAATAIAIFVHVVSPALGMVVAYATSGEPMTFMVLVLGIGSLLMIYVFDLSLRAIAADLRNRGALTDNTSELVPNSVVKVIPRGKLLFAATVIAVFAVPVWLAHSFAVDHHIATMSQGESIARVIVSERCPGEKVSGLVVRAYPSGTLLLQDTRLAWVPNSDKGACIVWPADPIRQFNVVVTPTLFGIEMRSLAYTRHQFGRTSQGVQPYIDGRRLSR